MTTPRSEWVRHLTAHPANTVIKAAQHLTCDWKVTHLELPQAGLCMLQVADGALHESYFLGECPLARCRVRVTLPDGRSAEGAAQVMADDAALAESLAVLDAVLAAPLPGADIVTALIEAGRDLRQQEDQERRALLGATRVDFALLGSAEEDDED